MKKYQWILCFLLLAFGACSDEIAFFEASTEGLEVRFTPVPGGAMMHYTLPNNPEIFAMNVRYPNWQGREVLKTCEYGGDSLLLDGFTRGQEVNARFSFVNHRNEESGAHERSFSTLNSAPWAFFDNLKVQSGWDGFQVLYSSPEVATGMYHVFYLGINPRTHQWDTIPVKSAPIRRGGDTINFVLEQQLEKSTVIVRTEDFHGFRVRQAIFPDIDAFRTEQWKINPQDFSPAEFSVEDGDAKVGLEYLFDGELKGAERMQKGLVTPGIENMNNGVGVYGTFLYGPQAHEKPMVLDLREPKAPAWIRLYAIINMKWNHSMNQGWLSNIWQGWYDDKLPCWVEVFGHTTTGDPDAEGWVPLGNLNQDPKASAPGDKWSYPLIDFKSRDYPTTWEDFVLRKPLFVDIPFPVLDNTYRYLKVHVKGMFQTGKIPSIDSNKDRYLTLNELEVYVKKN